MKYLFPFIGMGWRRAFHFVALISIPIALFACGDGCDGQMGVPGGDGGSDIDSDYIDPTACIDRDGDGYGRNCAAGNDCDDNDSERFANCTFVDFGEGSSNPWDPTAENSNGVVLDDDGGLTLDALPEIEPAVWIANAGEGTVSRLDALTGNEIGRYRSALTRDRTANDPSRTAIDFRGDCWVANRARRGHQQGSVSKIASHIEDCIDRNDDGEIQTSRDINGDGVISLNSEEFLGAEDECILFTVDIGDVGGIPRALAIAPDASGSASGGNAWVGLNTERRAAELNGDTGEVVRWVDLPLNPYGALASKYGLKVWFTNAGWQADDFADNSPGVASVDYRTGDVSQRYEVDSTIGCEGTYGITVDAQGRVWVGGYPCSSAFRFDPETESWFSMEIPGGGNTRGLVADADGWVWVAHSNNCGQSMCGLVSRFNGDDGSDLSYYYIDNADDTIGVDLDAEGMVWVVSQDTDNAHRINPATGHVDEFPTGDRPYTYSDFTGHSLLLQFPRGYYRALVEACHGAEWLDIYYLGVTEGDTAIEIRVRSAEEQVSLSSTPWIGPWRSSPINLREPPGPVPEGRFLEIEITLITRDDIHVPVLRDLEIAYECPLG